MISYRKEKLRHLFGMNNSDLADFAELIWLLKHNPPPIGFNRKPFTTKQQKVIDEMYDLVKFPCDYADYLNSKTGQ